jgi:hypothetical protein
MESVKIGAMADVREMNVAPQYLLPLSPSAE